MLSTVARNALKSVGYIQYLGADESYASDKVCDDGRLRVPFVIKKNCC
jgi:hypothetical protein